MWNRFATVPRLRLLAWLSLTAGALILPSLSGAPSEWPSVRFELLADGFIRPLAVVSPRDGTGRLFIVEQRGRIYQWKDGQLRDFLDLQERVMDNQEGGDERGLLGLVFSPGFAENQEFYVNYTRNAPAADGATVVSRFRTRPAGIFNPGDPVGDPDSEEVLLTVAQPFSNHNAGDLHFGPDGYLYIGMGDGGSGGDPGNRAQGRQELLGKMLRIDVEGAPSSGLPYGIPPDNPFVEDTIIRDEIWAFGLRNPWRWSFDRSTGDLYIGDVGQNNYEEISYAEAGSTGLNFGWRRYESIHPFNLSTELAAGVETQPILDLPQSQGERSITGGFVYRGQRFPRMQGLYLFGDYVSRRLFAACQDESGDWVRHTFPTTPYRITSFGEDENGELYLTDFASGGVYRILDTRDAAYLQIVSSAADEEEDQFRFTFGAQIGESYQVQQSSDLNGVWVDVGDPVVAQDYRVTVERRLHSSAATENGGELYLRAKRLD
ncbi:MAG TPA: PQQ-dependent sugar dehydrogenase [Verrucomicrobiales bacterium]|nr:PQQ-dependent sugar dehydrogenase [Verrucomicrobiales bacterium]